MTTDIYGGRVSNSRYEIVKQKADLQFMVHEDGYWGAQPYFYAGEGQSVRSIDEARPSWTLTEKNNYNPTGTMLCFHGQKTKAETGLAYTCGEVTRKFATNLTTGSGCDYNTGAAGDTPKGVEYRNCEANFVTISTTSRSGSTNKLQCRGGDSGGPVFANNTAYGIANSCSFGAVLPNGQGDPSQTLSMTFSPVNLFGYVNTEIMTSQ